MSDWIVYIIIFAIGAGSGALLATKRPHQGGKTAVGREEAKTLKRLYKASPAFFNCLRADLDKPEYRQVREFAILASSRVTFVSDVLRFVYYEEDLAELKTITSKLEDSGFVDDVTRGKTPIYRIRENFVAALEAL